MPFASCLPPAFCLPNRVLALYPVSPRQGDALFVILRPGTGAGQVRCAWDGSSVPVAQSRSAALAVIGLRITERPGKHSLQLEFTSPDGARHAENRVITVRRTLWPVTHLKMQRSVEKLYTFPGARQEDEQVSAAVRAFSDTLLWRGPFAVPTKGRISTQFGTKRIRNGHTVYYHRGLDLAAPTGTPITAPNAGRVVLARSFKKYGHAVVLDHGLGVTTLYLHMSALAVHQGDQVRRGQLIGKVGAEGVATGPHLHWSLYVRGNAVSPLFWTHLPPTVTTALPQPGA